MTGLTKAEQKLVDRAASLEPLLKPISNAQIALLRRAEKSHDGARLNGSGQHACARKLESFGLGRFSQTMYPEKARFYINDAGRKVVATLAPKPAKPRTMAVSR